MKEEKRFLNELLKDESKVIVAVSGGPDSMCLLDIVEHLEKKLEIIVVHIHHNTRDDCDKEYAFVKNYVQKHTLEFLKIASYQKGHFTEQEARDIRMQKFLEIAQKHQVKYILTAHHGDDLTETILMRLLRGSSMEGYAGMKKITKWRDVFLVKPLLTTTKKEIISYLESKQIPYMIDESNNSETYLRNRIRHHLLPILEKENKNYAKMFLKFHETLLEKNEVIQESMNFLKKTIETNGKINIDKLKDLSESTQKTYLEFYLKEIYQDDITFILSKHRDLMFEKMVSGKGNIQLDFPKCFLFIKRKNQIWLEKKENFQDYCIKCERKTILPKGEVIEQDVYNQKNNYEIHLNSKEVILPLYITTRKDGMKMALKNANGHKKVNDILIDRKVPKEKRDQVPIMVDQKGTVLWILGVSKSKYDLEKNENYDIIYRYIEREEL